mmetsp:Transcript_59136/g.170912  ORF Transcript_59136/g.170912 Transcript_59136/m.170912 type:complete len:230 (-) Transcript_59136:143-832(-)
MRTMWTRSWSCSVLASCTGCRRRSRSSRRGVCTPYCRGRLQKWRCRSLRSPPRPGGSTIPPAWSTARRGRPRPTSYSAALPISTMVWRRATLAACWSAPCRSQNTPCSTPWRPRPATAGPIRAGPQRCRCSSSPGRRLLLGSTSSRLRCPWPPEARLRSSSSSNSSSNMARRRRPMGGWPSAASTTTYRRPSARPRSLGGEPPGSGAAEVRHRLGRAPRSAAALVARCA